MKLSVVQIGNSQGVRIPKTVLEQCKIGDEVSLEVEGESIVIRPLRRKPRKNWEQAFSKMHKRNEDALIIENVLDEEDEGWEW